MVTDVRNVGLIFYTTPVFKLFKSKEAGNGVYIRSWTLILDTDDAPTKKLVNFYRAPTPERIASFNFSVSTTGILAGIKMSHAASSSICRRAKLACKLFSSKHIVLYLDP
ncbi:disco-interacting protein 2 homolog A [Nephila pilipes]|uniref:Disco-interacting protein 2 homolog A n=1 Tax=Nephila pilipes TaxID=299642 RepID=A0A8X6PS90_NEPPI|nr:disco-interacting protein 2 homolog A [Nephila pilipes]